MHLSRSSWLWKVSSGIRPVGARVETVLSMETFLNTAALVYSSEPPLGRSLFLLTCCLSTSAWRSLRKTTDQHIISCGNQTGGSKILTFVGRCPSSLSPHGICLHHLNLGNRILVPWIQFQLLNQSTRSPAFLSISIV